MQKEEKWDWGEYKERLLRMVAPEAYAKADSKPYTSQQDGKQEVSAPYVAVNQAYTGLVPASAYTPGLQTEEYPEKKSRAEKPPIKKPGRELHWATTPSAVVRRGAMEGPVQYNAGENGQKTISVPSAAELQTGIKPKSPAVIPKGSTEVGAWGKKKAPPRTSAEIREELETLEERYDKLIQEAEAWENQAGVQSTPEEMSQWGKRGRASRKEAAALEPYLDALQEEWEYAMDREWEAWKKQTGYRDASLWDMTVGSVKRGFNTAQYGIESYKDMMGDENNRKAEYEEKLSGEEYRFIPEKWWQQGLSGGLEMFGQQLRQWTDPETLAMGTAAAGGAVLAGNAGPQALLPEEVITVPAAFYTGVKFGSAKSNFEIEAGLAYNEMLENGVSEDTARIIAQGVGGANALLEFVQLDELVKSARILKDSGVGQNMLQKIVNELLSRGVHVGNEVLQEVAQEGVTMAGVQAGTKLDTGEWAYDTGEVLDRLTDTAASSALTFGTMAVPGTVMSVTGQPSLISDQAALKLLGDQRQVEFLTRKGGLKLTKDMSQSEKITAVRDAVEKIAGVKKAASMGEAGRPRITIAEFTDPSAPIWTNVAYEDTKTQAKITQDVHQEMVDAGQVVQISQETKDLVAQSYPDLRTMKKKERIPIIKQKIVELKDSLQNFLNGFKGTNIEFEIKGKVLEAKLYGTGIDEVLEKITQDKASMLYESGKIFKNAQYLYSTTDYDGDPNVYRWNYFYTPVQIGDDVVGVRIAVRDIATPQESQVYNWGIKKTHPWTVKGAE